MPMTMFAKLWDAPVVLEGQRVVFAPAPAVVCTAGVTMAVFWAQLLVVVVRLTPPLVVHLSLGQPRRREHL